MDVQFKPTYTALLLTIASVACGQNGQANVLKQCLDHSGSPTECSPKGANMAPYFDRNSVVPYFQCPDGYHVLYSQTTWLHACRPKSCPGLVGNEQCKTFSKNFITCPKTYMKELGQTGKYNFDKNGNLDNPHDRNTVPLGDYFIDFKYKRVMICDPNSNEPTQKPKDLPEVPRWCMPFAVPNGEYREKGGRLTVKKFKTDFELFTIEDDMAIVCSNIDPKIYETCGNDTGHLPGEDIEVLSNWDLKDTKPVVDKEIYRRGQYILAENMSYAIVCVTPDEPHLPDTSTAIHTSLPPSFMLLSLFTVITFFPIVISLKFS